MSEEIKTFDEEKKVGILSGKPPTGPQGPRRRAPMYYAGKTYGRRNRMDPRKNQSISAAMGGSLPKGAGRPMLYPDVERNENGSIPGVRNKAARRLIRGAFGRHFSKVERALKLPRAMQAQARELATKERTERISDYHNGNRSTYFSSTSGDTRWARRLFEKELAIHEPVYAPSQKELRAMRTAKRKLKRQGKQDAISRLVDKMAGPR